LPISATLPTAGWGVDVDATLATDMDGYSPDAWT